MSQEKQMLDELVRIREAVEPKAAPPSAPPKNLLNEFKDFLKQYKVMGLAVAFIMALYLGRLVQSLVTSFISPMLNVLFLAVGFLAWQAVIDNPAAYPTALNPTLFISELITFLIVAFVIFMLVKITTRLGIE